MSSPDSINSIKEEKALIPDSPNKRPKEVQKQLGEFVCQVSPESNSATLIGEVNLQPEEQREFTLMAERGKTPLSDGEIIGSRFIIDRSNFGPRLSGLLERATAISQENTPSLEKPKALLDLLFSQMKYGYPEDLQQAGLSEWFASTHPGLDSTKRTPISEIAEKGFGNCLSLSTIYALLAEAAGLDPVIVQSVDSLRNIPRKSTDYPALDKRQGLFRSLAVGETGIGHAWVETKITNETGDSIRVPVDPGTQLVGDTPDRLDTFREAGFIGFVPPYDIRLSTTDGEVVPYCIQGSLVESDRIAAGATEFQYQLKIKNESLTIPAIGGGTDEIIEATPFLGTLKISVSPNSNSNTNTGDLILTDIDQV